MYKLAVTAIVACALAGCAGTNYVISEYSGVPVVQVTLPDDTYRVFDKPESNKMMVTSSLASAAGQGLGQGLLLNAIDHTPPKPLFEAAARQHLQNTGRESCRLVDAYILIKPQFEVKYDCQPILAEVAKPRPQRMKGAK